jgi:hypothetical protein
VTLNQLIDALIQYKNANLDYAHIQVHSGHNGYYPIDNLRFEYFPKDDEEGWNEHVEIDFLIKDTFND